MISPQTTFNIIVNHLRQQGKKCENDEENCLYKGPNGLKCAAGCLIPDSLYSPSLEGQLCLSHTIVGKLIIDLGHDIRLVYALQNIHDNYHTDDWEDEFEKLANERSLTYTPKV